LFVDVLTEADFPYHALRSKLPAGYRDDITLDTQLADGNPCQTPHCVSFRPPDRLALGYLWATPARRYCCL